MSDLLTNADYEWYYSFKIMKLFLTSSCVSENLREPFLKFLGKCPDKVKFYFIPTATDVEEDKFYTCKSLDDFSAIGINPIWYTLKFKTKQQISLELSDADVIWIGGGNTFYLLDSMRRTGAMGVIDDLVRNKGVIFGGTSAGTIVATPTIEIAGWGDDSDTNEVKISDFQAFNFVNFFTQVHYSPVMHKDMLISQKANSPIYAIPDGAAVQVIDGKITTLGSVELFF